MRIAIFGNHYQQEKSAQAKRLFDALSKNDAELFICADFYHFLSTQMGITPVYRGLIQGNEFEADIALSLGGDGTFLKTAERVGMKQIPILGINTGRLGFLADISTNDIEEVVTELYKNYYAVEQRSLLRLSGDGLPDGLWCYALNEIALLKRDSSSMLSIEVLIDGNMLNNYMCDGLIVATPTGSTAYSLSVGAPVIVPTATNFVVTAVAPHSLNVRPLVINDDVTLTLRVNSRNNNFLVSLDGRSIALDNNVLLKIDKAPFTTRVIKRHNHTFYETLRNKLMWGVDKRDTSL